MYVCMRVCAYVCMYVCIKVEGRDRIKVGPPHLHPFFAIRRTEFGSSMGRIWGWGGL